MCRLSRSSAVTSLFIFIIAIWLAASCQEENVQPADHAHPHAADAEHADAVSQPADVEHVHPHPADADHADSTPVVTPSEPPKRVMENLITIRANVFDPSKGQTGKITYELLEPARVRIVITERSDPDQLYRILLWDWQEAGRHEVQWDGTDELGSFLDPKKCNIGVRWVAKSDYRPGTRVVKPLTTAELVKGLQGYPDHRMCDIDKCKPMNLRLSGVQVKDAEGDLIRKELSPGMVLSGVVTIEGEAAKEARGYADKTGFGVRWMIDQQLVAAQYYERECDGKFSYPIDTTAFQNGEHILRLSTCDHYDHTGLVSTKVVFDNK